MTSLPPRDSLLLLGNADRGQPIRHCCIVSSATNNGTNISIVAVSFVEILPIAEYHDHCI